MNLLKHNAQQIVKELNATIGMNINFMNSQGIIIASTDPGRIGQVHEGARTLLDRHLDELLVRQDDDRRGMKEGANYPIVIDNEVIGVIGITGECNEAEKFGRITKKMTEILMTELMLKEHHQVAENQKNRFVMEWTSHTGPVSEALIERGAQLGIDITLPRRFMLLSVHTDETSGGSMDALRDVEQTEERIKSYIRRADTKSVYMKSASTLLLGVAMRSDEKMRELAEKIIQKCGQAEGVDITIGIDSGDLAAEHASMASMQAEKALRSALRSSDSRIWFYRDIDMEIFIDEIPAEIKKEYIHKLFSAYDPESLREVIALLDVFYGKNGSLAEASESLHLHRNTLQYKLRRICEKTGRDPRSLKDAGIFRIAMAFFDDAYGTPKPGDV